MSAKSHARRIEHRANLRKAIAGQLPEAEAAAVQATEKARKEAWKPPVALNRKQRKNKKAEKRRSGK